MSVSTEVNKHVYDGDDIVIAFPFTFPIIDASDIEVYLKSDLNVITPLTSNYSVDVPGQEVLYPTVGSPLPTLWKIILKRRVPRTQELDLKTNSKYSAKAQEDALDKLTLIVQDLEEQLTRAVKYPLDETPTEAETAAFLDEITAAVVLAEAAAVSAGASAAAASASAIASDASAIAAAASAAAAETSAVALRDKDTYANLKAKALADPLTPRQGWATDMLQLLYYTGDITVGTDGWIMLGGGGPI